MAFFLCSALSGYVFTFDGEAGLEPTLHVIPDLSLRANYIKVLTRIWIDPGVYETHYLRRRTGSPSIR